MSRSSSERSRTPPLANGDENQFEHEHNEPQPQNQAHTQPQSEGGSVSQERRASVSGSSAHRVPASFHSSSVTWPDNQRVTQASAVSPSKESTTPRGLPTGRRASSALVPAGRSGSIVSNQAANLRRASAVASTEAQRRVSMTDAAALAKLHVGAYDDAKAGYKALPPPTDPKAEKVLRTRGIQNYARMHSNIERMQSEMQEFLEEQMRRAIEADPRIRGKQSKFKDANGRPRPPTAEEERDLDRQQELLDELISNIYGVRQSSNRFMRLFLDESEKRHVGARTHESFGHDPGDADRSPPRRYNPFRHHTTPIPEDESTSRSRAANRGSVAGRDSVFSVGRKSRFGSVGGMANGSDYSRSPQDAGAKGRSGRRLTSGMNPNYHAFEDDAQSQSSHHTGGSPRDGGGGRGEFGSAATGPQGVHSDLLTNFDTLGSRNHLSSGGRNNRLLRGGGEGGGAAMDGDADHDDSYNRANNVSGPSDTMDVPHDEHGDLIGRRHRGANSHHHHGSHGGDHTDDRGGNSHADPNGHHSSSAYPHDDDDDVTVSDEEQEEGDSALLQVPVRVGPGIEGGQEGEAGAGFHGEGGDDADFGSEAVGKRGSKRNADGEEDGDDEQIRYDADGNPLPRDKKSKKDKRDKKEKRSKRDGEEHHHSDEDDDDEEHRRKKEELRAEKEARKRERDLIRAQREEERRLKQMIADYDAKHQDGREGDDADADLDGPNLNLTAEERAARRASRQANKKGGDGNANEDGDSYDNISADVLKRIEAEARRAAEEYAAHLRCEAEEEARRVRLQAEEDARRMREEAEAEARRLKAAAGNHGEDDDDDDSSLIITRIDGSTHSASPRSKARRRGAHGEGADEEDSDDPTNKPVEPIIAGSTMREPIKLPAARKVRSKTKMSYGICARLDGGVTAEMDAEDLSRASEAGSTPAPTAVSRHSQPTDPASVAAAIIRIFGEDAIRQSSLSDKGAEVHSRPYHHPRGHHPSPRSRSRSLGASVANTPIRDRQLQFDQQSQTTNRSNNNRPAHSSGLPMAASRSLTSMRTNASEACVQSASGREKYRYNRDDAAVGRRSSLRTSSYNNTPQDAEDDEDNHDGYLHINSTSYRSASQRNRAHDDDRHDNDRSSNRRGASPTDSHRQPQRRSSSVNQQEGKNTPRHPLPLASRSVTSNVGRSDKYDFDCPTPFQKKKAEAQENADERRSLPYGDDENTRARRSSLAPSEGRREQAAVPGRSGSQRQNYDDDEEMHGVGPKALPPQEADNKGASASSSPTRRGMKLVKRKVIRRRPSEEARSAPMPADDSRPYSRYEEDADTNFRRRSSNAMVEDYVDSQMAVRYGAAPVSPSHPNLRRVPKNGADEDAAASRTVSIPTFEARAAERDADVNAESAKPKEAPKTKSTGGTKVVRRKLIKPLSPNNYF